MTPHHPRQQRHPRPPSELLITDGRTHPRIRTVGLPVHPALAGAGVIDQLEDVAGHMDLARPDGERLPVEHRAGEHVDIILGALGVAARVLLDLAPDAAVVGLVLRKSGFDSTKPQEDGDHRVVGLDAQSTLMIFLSDEIFPVIWALILSARVPVLIIVGIAFICMVVVVGFAGHGRSP